jgi:hypothetical protein
MTGHQPSNSHRPLTGSELRFEELLFIKHRPKVLKNSK